MPIKIAHLLTTLAVGAAPLAVSAQQWAEYYFEGTVTSVASNENDVLGAAPLGRPVTGRVIWKRGTDSAVSSKVGRYASPEGTIELEIDGLKVVTQLDVKDPRFPHEDDGTQTVEVRNAAPDTLRVIMAGENYATTFQDVRITLQDPAGAAIASDAELMRFDPTAFPSKQFAVRGIGKASGDVFDFGGTIDVMRHVPVTEGDFNGDGTRDLFIRNPATGKNSLWLMRGATRVGVVKLQSYDVKWTVEGVGDFNGDGKADVLWRNRATGATRAWLLNGATVAQIVKLPLTTSDWSVRAVGDVTGDGFADIVWFKSNPLGPDYRVWEIENGTVARTEDRDVFHHGARVFATGGRFHEWSYSRSGNRLYTTLFYAEHGNNNFTEYPALSTAWAVAGVGDYTGDGEIDVLYRHKTDGRLRLDKFLKTGTLVVTPVEPVPAAGWVIAGSE